jgi:hypothetical protein
MTNEELNGNIAKPVLGDVPFTDADGKPIFLGNIIEQINFNGEQYLAKYKVVIDPSDNEVCLWMISGNEKEMSSKGYSAFGSLINGKLRKGRVVRHIA